MVMYSLITVPLSLYIAKNNVLLLYMPYSLCLVLDSSKVLVIVAVLVPVL